jgi:hypothetical protein
VLKSEVRPQQRQAQSSLDWSNSISWLSNLYSPSWANNKQIFWLDQDQSRNADAIQLHKTFGAKQA